MDRLELSPLLISLVALHDKQVALHTQIRRSSYTDKLIVVVDRCLERLARCSTFLRPTEGLVQAARSLAKTELVA